MAEVIVFAGPCLPRRPDAEWRELLDGVDLRPPARRGDVLTALADRPRTLVLLDGLYYTVPAVTHKELLYALDAGVRVVGAASMGALRAAEMEAFGMEGVGWVFERYRNGGIVGDDEVAILHADAEHGFRPLTTALVDVRWALEALGSPAGASILVERLMELPFTRRDPAHVADLAREALEEADAESLIERLRSRSVKRDDGAAALRRARAPDVEPGDPRSRPTGPAASDARRAHTEYLSHFREWELRTGPEPGRPALREAWNVTQLLHPDTPRFVRTLRRRFVLASAAERDGASPGQDRIESVGRELAARARLPEPEIRDEARLQALAEEGMEKFGDVEEAGRFLAGRLRMGSRCGWPELAELLSLQDDLIPPWAFVRAFACTEAVDPALATAGEAIRIQRLHRESPGVEGGSIREDVLDSLAAELWGVPVDDVERHAAARGLFRSHGFTPGLRQAVELVAAVERMTAAGYPVNDYPEAKVRLRETPLDIVVIDTFLNRK